MHSIFLSYSFQNEDDSLIKTVRTIIDAIGFRVIDGKILDTNSVGPGVANKLRKCHGAICVLTKQANESGWVDAEFWQAVGANMKICLLYDDAIQLGNAYLDRVKFSFSSDDSLKAIEQLAGTLGVWKQALGVSTRVLLLPHEIGREAILNNATCEYRCIDEISTEESDWQEAKLVPYVAGVQAILSKVPPHHSIKIRLNMGHKIVNSVYTPQQITLQLN